MRSSIKHPESNRTLLSGRGRKGFVMMMVMAFVLLMSMAVLSFSVMIKNDMTLIARAKTGQQARNLAEAGIYHSLAKLRNSGIPSRADFSGSLDTGTYEVTYVAVGGRILVTSKGTVGGTGVSRTVSAELTGTRVPPALTKMFAGGSNIKARATVEGSSITVVGDIHANRDVELRALGGGVVDIQGDVDAVGIVREGAKHDEPDELDDNVFINGINNDEAPVGEGVRRIAFPVFDYAKYEQQVRNTADHYSGNHTFNNANLTPSKGFIYVEGRATIRGDTSIKGGIVADEITIHGTLTQTPHSGAIYPTRNFILAKSGEISIFDGIDVSEAIVYARTDIRTRAAGTNVKINGIILAETGDMSFWNVQTNVEYTYQLTYPSDLDLDFDYDDGEGTPDEGVRIVNWTR